METLIRIFLQAMISWIPLGAHVPEPESEVLVRYTSIATDVAEIVSDPKEPLLPKTRSRGDMGFVLLSIASLEGGFQKFVDDGTCNQKTFVPDARGSCDNHQAWSIWQVHVGSGLILSATGVTNAFYAAIEAREHPERVIYGSHLIADRKLAARVALHIVRTSLEKTGTLCMYSGEPCDNAPKAAFRWKRAENWFGKASE